MIKRIDPERFGWHKQIAKCISLYEFVQLKQCDAIAQFWWLSQLRFAECNSHSANVTRNIKIKMSLSMSSEQTIPCLPRFSQSNSEFFRFGLTKKILIIAIHSRMPSSLQPLSSVVQTLYKFKIDVTYVLQQNQHQV